MYQHVAFAQPQHHIIYPTNLCSALDDGIEDRLHVGRRAADDAEHFRRCRLVFQGLTEFSIALMEFLEKSHVLDGDQGLVCESFQKRDLLVREWMNFRSADMNRADRNPFAK